MKSRFKLYGQCIPVNGAKRSIICDLQRDNYELIPNALHQILTHDLDKSFPDIVSKYGQENESIISGYFEFLEKCEFGFWTETPELFPPNTTEWNHPEAINNAIIDSDKNSNHDFKAIFKQLEELNCEHLQLRFFDEISITHFTEILTLLDKSSIISVEVIKKYNLAFTEERYSFLLRRFLRITTLFIHSAPYDKKYKDANVSGPLINLVYLKSQIDSEIHCGQISEVYFAINMDAFNEALTFNSCLNKKIAIDKHGDIKNCPSMKENYGNIKNTRLNEALVQKSFKKIWQIKKDDISVCKDCEFRYICTDCRAYTINEELYNKPLKCMYNPYTAEWE